MLWWTQRKLRSSDARRRVEALGELRDYSDLQVIELILACLHDPDITVRRAAVSTLDRVSDPDGRVARALELLLVDEKSAVRVEAACALAAHRPCSPSAVAALVAWLIDTDELMRNTALRVLEQALPGGRALVEKLVRSLNREQGDYIESDVIDALRPYVDLSDLKGIREFRRSQLRRERERQAAAEAVESANRPNPYVSLDTFVSDAERRDSINRVVPFRELARVAREIGESGDQAAIPYLAQVYDKLEYMGGDGAGDAQQAVLFALGALGATQYLERASKYMEACVRQQLDAFRKERGLRPPKLPR